jgi:hypothetical protein
MAVYTTIDDPTAYYQTKIYTGNGTAIGSGGLAVTLDSDTDMQPDLVWIKNRETTDAPAIFDAVRGATKVIYPSHQNAEGTVAETLTAFGSDGFTVGSNSGVNTSADSHVAWCWKESATAGFDIVNHSGTGSNTTVSHALSAVPHFIVPKNRETAEDWFCYHHKMASDPETDYININATAVPVDNATMWQDTAPTSSVISVGTANALNKSGESIIYYIWTAKQGFSKFGSYEGNNNADGTFVYTGFRPALVVVKAIDTTGPWLVVDNKRIESGSNFDNAVLFWEATTAEQTTNENYSMDLLSNGFKLRSADDWSNDPETYIYMAWAEAPFVNSNGVPCNAR